MAASGLFEPLRFLGIRLADTYGAENYLEQLWLSQPSACPLLGKRRQVDGVAEVIESARVA